MEALRTNEKQLVGNSPDPCPHLPAAVEAMSYKNLRQHDPGCGRSAREFFEEACRYANYLWLQNLPARAILSLCRALYMDPRLLDTGTRQPYEAYAWMLQNTTANGFLGNPRFSFSRQATRVPESQHLKAQRAWALWYLTRVIRPELPADPNVVEAPPGTMALATFLNAHGLNGEGDCFMQCLTGYTRNSLAAGVDVS